LINAGFIAAEYINSGYKHSYSKKYSLHNFLFQKSKPD